MPESNANWNFGRGSVITADSMHVLSFPTAGIAHSPPLVTQVVGWSPEQSASFMIPWEAKALCFSAQPSPHVVIIGSFGDVLVITPQGNADESVDPSTDGPSGRGVLRDLRLIGGNIYAAGMGRQVYRRNTGIDSAIPGIWRRIDAGVVLPCPSEQVRGFNSIDGYSEDDIYAAGWQGEIWHYDGANWMSINSPTNLKLERLVCGGDGNVYAVGQVGVLLRGRGDQWEAVNHESTAEQFWGAEWYLERLWLSTHSGVFVLGPQDEVNPVDFGLAEPPSCGWLAAGDGILWSIGTNHLLYTRDGVEWTQVFF